MKGRTDGGPSPYGSDFSAARVFERFFETKTARDVEGTIRFTQEAWCGSAKPHTGCQRAETLQAWPRLPMAALVDKELTLAALRQAVQRGRLDAIQGTDGVWRSSRKALEEYRRTRQRRRAT